MVHQAVLAGEAAERDRRRRKRKRGTPTWLHQPAYVLIRAAVASVLTGDVARNINTFRDLGSRFARAPFNRRRLERARLNLAVAFPDWSETMRDEYAIRAYEHLFMLAVETAYTPRLLTEDGWSEYVQLGDMQDGLRRLLTDDTCILVTGHCGNWELLGYMMAVLGFPMHALYRPLDLQPLDNWVRRTRERRGLTLLDKFSAARQLPILLKKGYPVGFVADQNGGDRGLFVPFFGRLASTYKSIGLMAQRHNATIVCGCARRLVWERDGVGTAQPQSGREIGFGSYRGEPFRYRLDITDTIRPDDWADAPDPLYYITARYRRAIETMVRQSPEQYLWMHRYWKSRPRHERLGRPMPSSLIEKMEQLPWMGSGDVARVVEWSERDAHFLQSISGMDRA